MRARENSDINCAHLIVRFAEASGVEAEVSHRALATQTALDEENAYGFAFSGRAWSSQVCLMCHVRRVRRARRVRLGDSVRETCCISPGLVSDMSALYLTWSILPSSASTEESG